MIIKCGNCGQELGERGETSVIQCPECDAVTSYTPKQANMMASYSTPEPSEPEPQEAPPDGTRIMCPVCGRNLLGIWQDGVLQIKHQGREWMTSGGTVAIKCHSRCGGIIQIDTRVYELSIVSSFDAFVDSLVGTDNTGVVDATPGAIRLAEELGIPLDVIEGTGKDGRVTQPNVRDYADRKSKGDKESQS